MKHTLKTNPAPFQAVWDERKTFEFRNNDRNFQIGDTLLLVEFDPVHELEVQREIEARVTYVLRSPEYNVPEGYAILSIKPTLRVTRG